MKKILVSLMLLVMTALSAHAQFEKEVWYVNASLTGLDLSHSKNEGTNFGFALTGGAFVADNVAVLLNFKGNYVEHGMDETSIGAQGRYYFSSCGIYGGLGGLISHPGTFHDHQLGKPFFLKIFYDSGDYLRVSGAAPVGFHGGDQVWLDADPHIVQTKF